MNTGLVVVAVFEFVLGGMVVAFDIFGDIAVIVAWK